MRVVARMRYGCVREEAIVEERSFEDEVDEGVEEVPDEDYTEFGCCRGVEEAQGGDVGCY